MRGYSILGFAITSLACGGGEPMNGGSFSGSIGSGEQPTAGNTDDDTDDSAEHGDESSSPDGESDSTSGDSSGDGDSSSGAPSCEQEGFTFELVPAPPNVMLVLDKSRSMSNLWDHDANTTTAEISRWHSLYNVVEFLTDEFAATISFGAQLFPAADAYLDEPTNAFSCLVEGQPEVAVGLGTGAQILASIPPAADFSISGGTPASAGLAAAIEHLQGLPSDVPRAIVLLTDGAANCSDAEAAEDTLFVYDDAVPGLVGAAWDDDGIPTYVVGINILDELGTKPAVNPYEALTTVAEAGGVPSGGSDRFYNAFNELELADALEVVASRIECTVNLPESPEHADLVEVTVDEQAVAAVDDCETQDGWTYSSPLAPYHAITLCGSACTALQGGGNVQVDYNCP